MPTGPDNPLTHSKEPAAGRLLALLGWALALLVAMVVWPFRVGLRARVERRIRSALHGTVSGHELSRLAKAWFGYRAMAALDGRFESSLLFPRLSDPRGGVIVLPRHAQHATAARLLARAGAPRACFMTPPCDDPAAFRAQLTALLGSLGPGPQPIYPAVMVRVGLDKFDLRVFAPLDAASPTLVEELGRDLDDALRQNPAQYDWAPGDVRQLPPPSIP